MSEQEVSNLINTTIGGGSVTVLSILAYLVRAFLQMITNHLKNVEKNMEKIGESIKDNTNALRETNKAIDKLTLVYENHLMSHHQQDGGDRVTHN